MSDSTWTGPVQSENGFIPVRRDPISGDLTPTAFEIGIGKGYANNVRPDAGPNNPSLNNAATVFGLLRGQENIIPPPVGGGVPAESTNLFIDKIGGVITTNILIDLQGGYQNTTRAPDAAIGSKPTDDNYAYIAHLPKELHGLPTKVEMACIETPLGANPFINLVCSNNLYQSGEVILDSTLLIKGDNWIAGEDGRSPGGTQFINSKPLLYLSAGVNPIVTAPNFNAGKFQITVTSMNVDYETLDIVVDLSTNMHIE